MFALTSNPRMRLEFFMGKFRLLAIIQEIHIERRFRPGS